MSNKQQSSAKKIVTIIIGLLLGTFIYRVSVIGIRGVIDTYIDATPEVEQVETL